MNITAGSRSQAAVRGFTLIELLLTVVVLLLLIGSMVINFSVLQNSIPLDEGAGQLESALRYARAHAANTGCRVRFTFEELLEDGSPVPLGNLFAEWEPDALNRPGHFEPLRDVSALLESMMNAVQIEDVRALDSSGAVLMEMNKDSLSDEGSEISFAPILFYPDGSSDSAEIILSSRGIEETRRISVSIIGTTGVIRTVTLFSGANAEEQEILDWLGE